jgi:hypothetical protein
VLTRALSLGGCLWVEAPDDLKAKARWHHELSEDEREALAMYQAISIKSLWRWSRALSSRLMVSLLRGSVDDQA